MHYVNKNTPLIQLIEENVQSTKISFFLGHIFFMKDVWKWEFSSQGINASFNYNTKKQYLTTNMMKNGIKSLLMLKHDKKIKFQ